MQVLFEKIALLTDPVIEEGYLGVRDGKIDYIGTEKPEGYEYARIIQGKRRALIPGLVNTHVHIPMTLMRGFADDYDLETWLHAHIFPAEGKLDARCVRAGCEIGMAEMLASGTTSFSDSYFFSDQIAQAVLESGMKANIARAVTNFQEEVRLMEFPGTREAVELYENWNGAGDGRIRIDTAIHAEYTTSKSLWSELGDFAKEHDMVMQIHMSETEKEHRECVARYGKTPARVFYDAGVYDAKTIAAHGVWLTDEDMDILRECGVTVAHNPVSNLKLASGIARVPELLSRGINVSLGTDGVASNNNFDLFEELKLTAILHKGAALDPTVLCARDAFLLATENGAAAQGREQECGKLAVGLDADLAMLDLDKPHWMPCHNLLSNVVYAARGSDVCMTMVRGKILYENGTFPTIDLERTQHEMRTYAMPHMFGK